MARDEKDFFEKLTQLLDEMPDGMDMTAMELAAEKLKNKVGEAALAKLIERLGPEDSTPKPCPKCGKPIPVKAAKRRRRIRSLSGWQTLFRNYHHCSVCEVGFYPRDGALGLPEEGELTYEVEKRVLDLAVNETYERGAERWDVHYSSSISSNLLRRVVDRVGARSEAADADALNHSLLPRTSKPRDALIVQTDGSLLPMRGAEPWKEAKLAVIVRAEDYVSHRETMRGQISQARYIANVGTSQELEKALESALRVEEAKQARAVVWLGDGAHWNWSLSKALTCQPIEILDWYHALEHAMDCGKVLLDAESPLLPLWKRRAEQLLADGDIDVIVRELMECINDADIQGLGALDKLIAYYRSNQSRMKYKEYLEQGLPIGSGIVESGHRHVFQERMKRAGQHWSLPRARRMATLRAAYRTAGPRRFHKAILGATKTQRRPPSLRPAHGETKLIHPGLRNRIRASNR